MTIVEAEVTEDINIPVLIIVHSLVVHNPSTTTEGRGANPKLAANNKSTNKSKALEKICGTHIWSHQIEWIINIL